MENIIQRLKIAIGSGADREQIHSAYIQAGFSEEDFFLAYIAAELLLKAQIDDEIRLKRRPPPFGRR